MAIAPQFALYPPDDQEPSKTSLDCVYSFDLQGNLIEMNAALAEITGYDRDEAIPLNLSQLLDRNPGSVRASSFSRLLGGSGAQKLELTAIAKDGRRIQWRLCGACYSNAAARWRFRMPDTSTTPPGNFPRRG
jgi:PAS domain S-box-containing protein